uniref:Mindbomb E3 ubiquitin protein ligase 1 n=1 Tax=Molossus molossus TaxID=27622 RepID=A0A7J8HIR8_MOLMO|nr:mindbomb E3 ubiquitin protein ligase 1 [Molossus molossus]
MPLTISQVETSQCYKRTRIIPMSMQMCRNCSSSYRTLKSRQCALCVWIV